MGMKHRIPTSLIMNQMLRDKRQPISMYQLRTAPSLYLKLPFIMKTKESIKLIEAVSWLLIALAILLSVLHAMH
jgi:hypothetical protein